MPEERGSHSVPFYPGQPYREIWGDYTIQPSACSVLPASFQQVLFQELAAQNPLSVQDHNSFTSWKVDTEVLPQHCEPKVN